ncbi:hypothetical protein [Actinoplanes sp. NPDC026623]|uniref:hypothetical protein n=1 Tax=Actinoplanes sp. NPDC026623 TaxID=3155610 RepID=UPI00340E681F
MTADPLPAYGEPRRLLSDVHALARRVRLDQRLTWVTLLVLAVVTYLGIWFDVHFMSVHCAADHVCRFSRQGVLYYWPPALLLAYAAIAYSYIRVARARGLGARVMPYAITGAVTTLLFTAAWVAERIYLAGRALADNPQPSPPWVLFIDRLIGPWGMIGIALLVLARLERNFALFAFTAGYLAVVLVPINFGWVGNGGNTRMYWVPGQVISATVLLLGAAGFAMARRRRR